MDPAGITKPRILAFAGSAREGSFNKRLVRLAARAAEEAGGQATLLDLRDLPMPLYDGDLEAREGLPVNARRFKQALASHPGWLLACPEYNGSVTPLWKNAIDWASRSEGSEEAPLAAFRGKAAALFSASPGALGGLRGLVHVRSILGNVGVLVLPEQVALPHADTAFLPDGSLSNEKKALTVSKLAAALVDLVRRFSA